MAHSTDDDRLSPPDDMSPAAHHDEPGNTGKAFDVPEVITQAGHDTNVEQADSPESLDQEITEGANRVEIDPQHSIIQTDPEDMNKTKELNEDNERYE